MFKKTICLLLLCPILLILSCTVKNPIPDSEFTEPEYTMATRTYFVHQNTFYYRNNRGCLYYCALEDLNEIEKYEKCFCFDPLCDHTNRYGNLCSGVKGIDRMCVRTIGDTTYLFGAYGTTKDFKNYTYEISCFDVSNAKETVLVKGIEKFVNRFFVTDDHIVIEYNSDGYRTIKAYSFSDEKTYELPNEDNESINLIGYDNGLVYYNDMSGNVYSNSPTLDNEEKIFTGILPYGYCVYNGELYFPHKMKSEKVPEVDWVSFNSVDVYKTSLSSPSKTNSSMVAKDICSFGKASHFIIDGTFYYLPSEPKYLGIFTESYEGMPDMTHAVVDEHGGTLCSVDLQRLRKTNLVEGLEYNIYELVYASPEYVIFRSNASGNRTDIPFSSAAATFAYEVQTKECYMIAD